MIDSRVETVAIKPGFRKAFKKRRLLIQADGVYEWKGKKREKQPMFITTPDKASFAFAGLWEIWHERQIPDTACRFRTINTRDAAGPVREFPHRMPVILHPDLRPVAGPRKSSPGCACRLPSVQGIVTELVFRPVHRQVNAAGENDPSNRKPPQIEFDFLSILNRVYSTKHIP
jgi:hypothetical protein